MIAPKCKRMLNSAWQQSQRTSTFDPFRGPIRRYPTLQSGHVACVVMCWHSAGLNGLGISSKIRAADAKEVGIGNPARQRFASPNQRSFVCFDISWPCHERRRNGRHRGMPDGYVACDVRWLNFHEGIIRRAGKRGRQGQVGNFDDGDRIGEGTALMRGFCPDAVVKLNATRAAQINIVCIAISVGSVSNRDCMVITVTCLTFRPPE